MMPATPTPFPIDRVPMLAGKAAYTSAVFKHLAAFHPGMPRVHLAEHVYEPEASAATLIVDIPLLEVGDTQMGPGLEVTFNLELVVATNRGKEDAGVYDCDILHDQTIALVHETRFGLGDAVDPARFVGSERDGLGAFSDNFIAWRLAFRQTVRLAVPSDLADNMALIIDDQRIYEVWLGIDPKIGIAHLPDYVLVGKVTDADYDAAQGGTQ